MIDLHKLQAAYQIADHEFRIRHSKIGCIVALILVPAGISLDFFVYPHLLGTIFAIRLSCDVLLGVMLALHFFPMGDKYQRYLIFAWPIIIDIAICVMIYLSEGASSPYYAGLNLVIICVTFLLPLTLREAVAISGTTILIYFATIVIHDSEISNHGDLLFNNVFFLVLTGIISCTASFFNAQRRFSEFRLQYELNIRNNKLAELDHLKSQFFANISHELRTPLTMILTPVQDLLQSGIPQRMVKPLQLVEQNALRLLKLVNDLLDLIQLEAGKKTLEKQSINLHALLNSLIQSMQYLAVAKQLTLKIHFADDTPSVFADANALEKIVINLLNNAIKFTDEGGCISVSTEVFGQKVQIQFEDTGMGIMSKDLPYIFDRFSQADGANTRHHQGTGIGLALVRDLVQQHDGEVEVSSQPGLGTSLVVTLPLTDDATGSWNTEEDVLSRLHQAADRYIGLQVEVDPVTEDVSRSNGKPKLLIVDDEPDILRYLSHLLADDYHIIRAIDGRQALIMAKQQMPDLILLDFMLPEVSGLEVSKQLRQDPETQSIKIMLLTARVDEPAKITALEHGADDFLTKPFSSTEVKTRLRNLLQTAQLEQSLREHNEQLKRTLRELKETESQLVHSEKLNALGHLSAGLLHEINNPLNYALTATQILQQELVILEDEDLKDTVEDILEGMHRIRFIVSDLRSFAYANEVNEYQVFAFDNAVDTARRFVSSVVQSIHIEQQLDGVVSVLGSHANIVQVLVNLLSNAALALKNTEDPRIRIKSYVADGRLHVRVMDNGSGIELANETQIFNPFFTTREVGEGVGLGLSVSHTIIKSHGGTLGIFKEEEGWTILGFDLALSDKNSSETEIFDNMVQRKDIPTSSTASDH